MGCFWSYVPHFIHSPFYVYAYAFGDCLVNALYSVFQSGHPGFQAKYLDMLRARGDEAAQGAGWRRSGWMRPTRRFGIRGWDRAVISGFIDELEAGG